MGNSGIAFIDFFSKTVYRFIIPFVSIFFIIYDAHAMNTTIADQPLIQTITGLDLDNATFLYGSLPITVTGTNSGNPLKLNFNSIPVKGVVTIIGNTIRKIGLGTVTVTGTQDGNSNYDPVTVVGTFSILPTVLSIKVNDAFKVYGNSNPIFSSSVLGLVNNETITINYFCDVNTTTQVGSYPILITVSGNALKNYALTTIGGSLIINKADQTINIPEIPNYSLGLNRGYLTILNIYSSSGLPVDLSVAGRAELELFDSGVAVVGIDSAGIISITGNQSGNENYNPALQIVRLVSISSTIGISSPSTIPGTITGTVTSTITGTTSMELNNVNIYPNPSNGTFYIDLPIMATYKVLDLMGETIEIKTTQGKRIPIYLHQAGIYFTIITIEDKQKTFRIAVE